MRAPPPDRFLLSGRWPNRDLDSASICRRDGTANREKGAFPGPRKGASAEGVLELERGQKGGNGDTTTLCRLDCSVARSRLEGESCFLCRSPPEVAC